MSILITRKAETIGKQTHQRGEKSYLVSKHCLRWDLLGQYSSSTWEQGVGREEGDQSEGEP